MADQVKLVTGFKGVDLYGDASQIDPTRWRRLQNMAPLRSASHILGKRNGSAVYNATPISGASKIDNMMRAWKSNGTKAVIAAINHGTNDELHSDVAASGTFVKITGGTAPPTNSKWFFVNWPLLGKVYAFCGDGTVPIAISSDFSTKADMAAPAPNLPDARFGQFGAIFFSSLISARTPTNPNYYYVFDVASDTAITNATQFGRITEPITGMGVNAYGSVTGGLQAVLLIFGAHSLWYVGGPPLSTGVQQASSVIGCKSPKTVVNTPLGLMFLGSDRTVYLVNTDPAYPRNVGLRIFPELLAIPETQLINACAAYHNGFYKLRFAATGGTTNTVEYWADLLPVLFGLSAEIEWYGPMVNLALLSLLVEDGPNDALPLLGGGASDGQVWSLDQAASFADGATAVSGQLYTGEYTEQDPLRQKIWSGFTFGYLKTASGQLAVTLALDSGGAFQSKTFSWSITSALWDVALWDVAGWAGTLFTEDALNWDTRVVARSLQEQLTHAAAADFQLRDYGRKYRVIARLP